MFMIEKTVKSLSLAFGALAVLIFLAAFPTWSQETCPPLGECADGSLQEGLEACLASLNLDKAIEAENLCVVLVDLSDRMFPRLASVNGQAMMYAASLPKIAILLGVFDRLEQDNTAPDPAMQTKLSQMIRNSSNEAATEMLNWVGKPYLADLLQSPPYHLYDPALNGGIWVGKGYGKRPAWKRDPMHNLSHGATAFQVARFYYLLETGRLVSPEASGRMKAILKDPAIHHKFVKGLEDARPGSQIYRKSGTWKDYHCDSALVERGDHRYIAVALARSPQGDAWLSRLIVAMDDLICQPEKASSRAAALCETSP